MKADDGRQTSLIAMISHHLTFRVVCWSYRAHFVPVDSIKIKETLYFFGHDTWLKMVPRLAKFAKPDKKIPKAG
jgi:hypothetical protein